MKFTVDLNVHAPATAAWDALVNWEDHARWIPATTVTVDPTTPAGIGQTFVGRTGYGILAFDDPMTVTDWTPATITNVGHCAVIKTGRFITGTASFTVTPRNPHWCQISWTEDIQITPHWLTRLATPILRPLGAAAFRRMLTQLAADITTAVPVTWT
jgi:carbon monoxide dehydrogenase subunit G